jgi:K+ transporter
VIAAMAGDLWMPHQFSSLSSRLVTQNGVLLMGVAALGILFLTGGAVQQLLVLYSINVFLTFTCTLFGLCRYWTHHREVGRNWMARLALAVLGCAVTGGILIVTVWEKFLEGGWVTLLITGCLIGLCFYIRKHYDDVRQELSKIDALYDFKPPKPVPAPPQPVRDAPTAVFLVGRSLGTGMHSVLWVNRLFPRHFRNYVFLSVGEVDSESFEAEHKIDTLRREVDQTLGYFINFAHARGIAAKAEQGFGTDVIEELTRLSERVTEKYPNSVFFASKLIFGQDNWFTSLLHNQTAVNLQRRLHLRGVQMMILPMKVG